MILFQFDPSPSDTITNQYTFSKRSTQIYQVWLPRQSPWPFSHLQIGSVTLRKTHQWTFHQIIRGSSVLPPPATILLIDPLISRLTSPINLSNTPRKCSPTRFPSSNNRKVDGPLPLPLNHFILVVTSLNNSLSLIQTNFPLRHHFMIIQMRSFGRINKCFLVKYNKGSHTCLPPLSLRNNEQVPLQPPIFMLKTR